MAFVYEIDGNDITEFVTSQNALQKEGSIIPGQNFSIVPDDFRIRVQNFDGRFDFDKSGSFLAGLGDGYSRILDIKEGDEGFWSGWIEEITIFDDDNTVEIRAINFTNRMANIPITLSITDTPSACIRQLFTNIDLGSVFIDESSFDAEDAFDTDQGFELYCNINAGSEINAFDVLSKLLLIGNKRIRTYRNTVFLSHEYPYTGGQSHQFSEADVVIGSTKRHKDVMRVANNARVAYKNASTSALDFIERTAVDAGSLSVGEYTANLTKYSKRYWPIEEPFFVDSSTGELLLAHNTLASATAMADYMVILRYEAPLVIEFEPNLMSEAKLARWKNIPNYGLINLTWTTPSGNVYNNEPLEIEFKRTDYINRKGFCRARFLNRSPQRINPDQLPFGGWDEAQWENNAWS